MTYERHSYTRVTMRPDGSTHEETVTLSYDELVFGHGMGSGDRLAFLELLNKWNRASAHNVQSINRYVYYAPATLTQDN